MTQQQDSDSNLSENGSPKVANEPVKESWTNHIGNFFQNTKNQITKIAPVNQVSQKVSQWFSVDENQVTEILAAVREQMPTTEAMLIGKPQAGKSSIVRGLTGCSAEIVGQGFRPHTKHTQRYAYPSNDLPLLVFTDTVGLGDVNRDTEAIIQELTQELKNSADRARVLILTVKINDFATDTLRQIAEQLRKSFPEIPCLLAVTSLHQLYPHGTEDHPPYPPEYETITRPFEAIKEAFTGLYDGLVLIDFTLEEDAYNPVFYGLETFASSLGDLLPEAESKAIYQLLDQGAKQKIGTLYKDVARRYILAFSIMAATVEAIPIPFAGMPVLTAQQVSMVGLLGKLYGQNLTPSQAGGLVSAIAGGFVAQAVGRQLIKLVPGFGSVIASSWAAAYTWALGEAACVYFGELMGGNKPDPAKIQAAMNEAFNQAKEKFKQSNA